MFSYARNIARHEFKSSVMESNDGKLKVVDFWAPWCGPCKSMEPILEKMAQQLEYKVDFYKINVDDEPELAGLLGIRSVPTLNFYKGGKKIDTYIGAMSEQLLRQLVMKNM